MLANIEHSSWFFLGYPDQAPPPYLGPPEAVSKQDSGGSYPLPYPPPEDVSSLYPPAAGPYPAPTVAPEMWQVGVTSYPPQ